MMRVMFAALALSALVLPAVCLAVEANTATAPAPSGKWEKISDGVVAELEKAGAKLGFPGKETAGIAVDPATGDVFMVMSDQGIWKSTDHGATFARCDNKMASGRCETGWTINVDPAGKRLAMFMVYSGGVSTDDSGKTWKQWKNNHFDVGAVDWENGGKTLLAMKHESGGDIVLSTDAGATWKSLGKGYGNVVGAFDDKTLLVAKGKDLQRSEDGGATWSPVSGVVVPRTGVVRVFKGVGYLLSPKGVQVTKDKGKTWAIMGSPVEACSAGPFFKDEKTMIVATPGGFAMTQDAGKDWKIVAPLPPDMKVDAGAWFPNFGWDPQANILYASWMGKPSYRFVLPPWPKTAK